MARVYKIFVLFFLILSSYFLVKYKSLVLDFLFTKKEAKVLFIGDSITQGTEWKILLSRLDVKNIAEGGYTTSHLIAESYLQKIEDSNAEVFLFPPAIKI